MEILYADESILLCVKPAGVLSTDEPGGLPELVRRELGDERADLRTVHRLDRAVSGLMLLARNAEAASALSRQIREGGFEKQYLAVVHGSCEERAVLRDLLLRDKARKMSFVVHAPGKGVQEAVLDYEKLWEREGLSCVRVNLHTGRTHQIRVQFASRGLPLVGERKYCQPADDCPLALWSRALGFVHPKTGEFLRFKKEPPAVWPWTLCE
ncbi:MAG: RluA family pseudouridine synthase [Oscillospiraceae bacterium]|nr:RluA family pseudouridine synthase [Oscillospiraceae bacterium]